MPDRIKKTQLKTSSFRKILEEKKGRVSIFRMGLNLYHNYYNIINFNLLMMK